MKMWRYFDIGDGIEQDYSDISIKPTIELLLPYSKTESNVQRYQSGKQKKKRDDRQLCTLQFCPEINCTASFKSSSELEEHMLSGLHNVANSTSWLDQVRKSFVQKMKITSQLHMPVISRAEEKVIETVPDCMKVFESQGWALPIRSKFRFSKQQKSLLYGYFIDGEESGKKMSPEQVHLLLRKDLSPDQYVTSQQIRSLFSR